MMGAENAIPGGALSESLRAAELEVEQRRAALRKAIDRRNALVVRAIDVEGMSQREVSRALGLRRGAVHSILADSGAAQLDEAS